MKVFSKVPPLFCRLLLVPMKDQNPKNAMKNQNNQAIKAFKALGNVLSEGLQEYKDLCVVRAVRDQEADGFGHLPLEVVIKRAEALATSRYWSRKRAA